MSRFYFFILLIFVGVFAPTIQFEITEDLLNNALLYVGYDKPWAKPSCHGLTTKLKITDIDFYLYNRSNSETPTLIKFDNEVNLDRKKPLKFITHGWISESKVDHFQQLKDAYLKKFDCNVIILDWSKYSQQAYLNSYCYVKKIAKLVANFLCYLRIPLDDIDLVGHASGGQMMGFVGRYSKKMCGKISNIVGLDPAGPLFQNAPIYSRLDASDAKFVQVIHTNQGVLGYWGDCGTVDFYVNCGVEQPDCPKMTDSIKTIVDFYKVILLCSHTRSVTYFTETILGSKFYGEPCLNCPSRNCISAKNVVSNNVIMGVDCPRTAHGPYAVYINN